MLISKVILNVVEFLNASSIYFTQYQTGHTYKNVPDWHHHFHASQTLLTPTARHLRCAAHCYAGSFQHFVTTVFHQRIYNPSLRKCAPPKFPITFTGSAHNKIVFRRECSYDTLPFCTRFFLAWLLLGCCLCVFAFDEGAWDGGNILMGTIYMPHI